MKKVLLIAGIIALFASFDVMIHYFWPKDQASSLAPSGRTGEQVESRVRPDGGSGRPVKKPKPLVLALPRKSKKKRAEPESAIIKEVEAFKTLARKVLGKKGKGLTAEDVREVFSLKSEIDRRDALRVVYEYLICKALEKGDFSYCLSAETLLEKGRRAVSCETAFKVFVTVGSIFHGKMTFPQFQALVSRYPDGIRPFMEDFFKAIEAKDSNQCPRLAEDPFTLLVCKVATGKITSPPKETGEQVLYYHVDCLRTGDFSRVPEPIDDHFVSAQMGEKGLCEENFNDFVEDFSKSFFSGY